MAKPTGSFVWYELMTPDAKAAEAFYGGVLGWSMRDAGMPDFAYTILSVGEARVGGLMTIPPEAYERGARPGWIGHIAVDDVDVFAARVKQAGGSVHRPPTDIPGVGRFSVVADPHGAKFILFHGSVGGPDHDPAPGTPGYPGWRELHAGDVESAFAFYSGLFGWTKDQTMDMGPMGVYQLFAIGGVQAGGMMTKTEAVPAPFWLYYFNVEAIEAAMSRVKDGGGQVIHGPHEVPGGMWIIQCLDPQGVIFALVGPKG